MVSYFKTQWFRFLVGCLCTVFALVYMFKPASDTSTLAGLEQELGNLISCLMWFVSAIIWFISSIIENNVDNIKALNKRIEELEERAVTDIDETETNHFTVRRRLGPDKNLPLPDSISARIEDTDKRFAYFTAATKTLGFVPGGEKDITVSAADLRKLAFSTIEAYKNESLRTLHS